MAKIFSFDEKGLDSIQRKVPINLGIMTLVCIPVFVGVTAFLEIEPAGGVDWEGVRSFLKILLPIYFIIVLAIGRWAYGYIRRSFESFKCILSENEIKKVQVGYREVSFKISEIKSIKQYKRGLWISNGRKSFSVSKEVLGYGQLVDDLSKIKQVKYKTIDLVEVSASVAFLIIFLAGLFVGEFTDNETWELIGAVVAWGGLGIVLEYYFRISAVPTWLRYFQIGLVLFQIISAFWSFFFL